MHKICPYIKLGCHLKIKSRKTLISKIPSKYKHQPLKSLSDGKPATSDKVLSIDQIIITNN